MLGPDQPPDLERGQTDDPRQEEAQARDRELHSREREFQLAMACLLTSPVMNEVERRPRKKDRVKRLKRKRKSGGKKKNLTQQTGGKADPTSTARTSR